MLPFARLQLLPLKIVASSLPCLFSSPTTKVSPGPLKADGYSLRHRLGLRGLRARPSERDESFREGQHVFPNVADDQPKQRLGEQRRGVDRRHSEGTGTTECLLSHWRCSALTPHLRSCCF